jgi:tetratricopeptide (TPR) repeat protein
MLALPAALCSPVRAADDPHAAHHMMGATVSEVPLYTNMGHWHRTIHTNSAKAQRYFDQGLTLVYSFNHEEAERAFREGARLDPNCAACWWGVALSLGPHINVPAVPPRTHAAFEAIHNAQALAAGATPVERELIDALARRYVDPQPSDPKQELAAETAYADAMREVHRLHRDDSDIATLYAEALMDLRPWDYWTPDGKPQPGTEEIVSLLEGVIAKHPDHPGANHYYIHAVEASAHPERALASAKRLETLVPGAGHMVHMPSHAYERLGRYSAAAQSNRDAIKSDDWFMNAAHPQGFFLMYTAHNRQFLACAAMMLGRSAEAIAAAHSGTEQIPFDMSRQMPGTDFFYTTPYVVLTQFERWDDMLNEPAPPADLAYLNAMWHYGRGLAFNAKGDAAHAAAERDSVANIAAAVPPEAVEDLNSARMLLGIALAVLEGRITEKRGDMEGAEAKLTRAIAGEDSTHYSEPPDWLCPVRPMLGALLLRAKRPAQAEVVYRADLARHPESGWSLNGLAESLRAQRRSAEAATASHRFSEAWKGADISLAMGTPATH